MNDILNLIVNDDREHDPDGRLLSLPEWSNSIAYDLALHAGITLTDKHLPILTAMRAFYCTQSEWTRPRDILKVMESAEVAEQYTDNPRKELYQLFPNGPVRQGCELAGLPIPDNASNPSFGNVI